MLDPHFVVDRLYLKELKSHLEKIETIEVKEKNFRNNWYPILKIKVKGNNKFLEQPLPLISKREFVSPLLEDI